MPVKQKNKYYPYHMKPLYLVNIDQLRLLDCDFLECIRNVKKIDV